MIEFLLHAPSRAAFLAAVTVLKHPLNGGPLASAANGVLVPSRGVRIDEVGEVWKVPPEIGTDGNETAPGVKIPGWHVNVAVTGKLAEAIGSPESVHELLGDLAKKRAGRGVPAGRQGTSGIRIIAPAAITSRRRVWA